MRNLKFRAWDTQHNIMYPGFELKKYMSYSSEGQEDLVPNVVSKIKLMQFTGLLDKNGKEICEGDIISIIAGKKSIGVDANNEWIIVYNYYYYLVEYGDITYPDEGLDIVSGGFRLPYNYKEWAVAGNIFENPELLG